MPSHHAEKKINLYLCSTGGLNANVHNNIHILLMNWSLKLFDLNLNWNGLKFFITMLKYQISWKHLFSCFQVVRCIQMDGMAQQV